MPPEVTPGRVPPHSLEAERSVLGAVLLDNEALFPATEHLVPGSFYQEAHASIFAAMLALWEARQPVDLVTLSSRMEAEGTLSAVGGRAYLASLADAVPTAAHAAHYARLVREKSVLRQLIGTATAIVGDCFEGPTDVDLMLDEAERRIFEISEKRVRSGFQALRDLTIPAFKSLQELAERKGALTGVPTGFERLDELTSGLQKSDLIIIAARPSMGKTALALNIAQNAALRHKHPVGIFSLEMGLTQLIQRLIFSEAKVDGQKARRGRIEKSDWPNLSGAMGRLHEAPIYIDDTPALGVLEMRAKARRLKLDKGLDLLIVDYLQLMRGRGRTDSREQEISEISRSLKALAKELEIPVIALSQLNREVEKQPGQRPNLSNLRESGAIEQDADVIMFIHREEYYLRNTPDKPIPPEKKGVAEVIVAKQRNGPTDTVKLAWLSDITRFEDLAPTAYYGEGG